jgi:hypothetical protein
MPTVGPELVIPFTVGEGEGDPSGEYLYQRVLPLFAEDEKFGFFGKHLCDALMAMMQGLDQILIDSDSNPGWTSIADPVTCPEAWLPWCAQLLGVVLPPDLTAEQQRSYIIEHPAQKRGTRESLLTFIHERAPSAQVIERENPNGEAKAYWFLIVAAPNEFAEAIQTTGNVVKGSAKVTFTHTAGMRPGALVSAAGFPPGATIKEVNGVGEFTASEASSVTASGESITVLNESTTSALTNYVNTHKVGGLKWQLVLRSYRQLETRYATYAQLEAAYPTYSNLETGP